MSSKPLSLLDCKVEVRKYVLVPQPSRWRQKSGRVVVQSPMLKISKTVSVVPVKRYHGEEQNSVCFIPKTDIEKDTSKVYDKAQVSKTTSWIDAHGVALFDSSVHEQVGYRQGDKFWICIGASTDGHEHTVPVINLRTFDKGDVRIDQVCWYPKIQGPNQELWTLGGASRKLKHCGAGNYSHWSWVVCQKLDGSPSTTKTVEIPTKDSNMKDRRLLSAFESRSLFEKRRGCMTSSYGDQSESRSCSPRTYVSRNQIFLLPTPPGSPEEQLGKCLQAPHRATGQAQQQPPHIRAWRGIFAMAEMRGGTYDKCVSRNGLMHRQEVPQSYVGMQRPLHKIEAFAEEEDVEMSHETSTSYSTREPTPSRADGQDEELFSHIFRKDKESLEKLTQEHGCLTFSPIEADFYTGGKSVREEYERSKGRFPGNPILTARCSLYKPQCAYTRVSTTMHYHCPPDKCILSKPTLSSVPATAYQDVGDDHEHCISRLGPYPGSAGECYLANSPHHFPNHICCCWKDEDLARITRKSKRIYDDHKLLEVRKKHMPIYDRRAWVGQQLGAGEKVTLRDCDLDIGGRNLLDADMSGELDIEVGDLPMLADSSVNLMDELNLELVFGGAHSSH